MNANRYLKDNFAPVAEEITTTNLRVTGAIPRELNGRYLRNGPNPMGPVDPAKHHWFTGAGMVHGVRLANGRAQWYRNRWVRSAAVVEALGEDVGGTRTRRREQHARDRSRRTNLGAGRGRLAARGVVGRTRHARRQRVLRHADGPRVHRAPEGRSRYRRSARDLLSLAGLGGSSAVRTRRQERSRRADGEHSGARHDDGARREPHAELCRRVRPAGDDQSRNGDGGHRTFRSRGTTTISRASDCCRATVRRRTSSGSKSARATYSIR